MPEGYDSTMEVKPSVNVARKTTAEFVGSLALGFAASVALGSPAATIAGYSVGLAWIVLLFAFGPLSGGHFNWAVTAAVWLRGKLSLLELILYLIAQFLGALVGAALGSYIGDYRMPEVPPGVSDGRAFGVELLLTSFLVYVYLQTCSTKAQRGNSFYGFTVGLYYYDINTVDQYSSSIYNPTLALGLAIPAESGKLSWVSIIAPLVGSVVALVWFVLSNPKEFSFGIKEDKFATYMKYNCHKYFTEFIGTVALCLTAYLAGGVAGLTLLAFVYAGGYISGAHYNPAVTVAHLVRRLMPVKDGIIYIVVQLVAGLVAGALGRAIQDVKFYPGMLRNDSGKMFVAELVFSCVLILVVLSVASKKHAGNQYYGYAIGGTISAAAVAIATLTGAVLNPAVGLAICTQAEHNGDKYWVYAAAPLAAGIVMPFLDKFMHPKNYDDSTEGRGNDDKHAPLLGDDRA